MIFSSFKKRSISDQVGSVDFDFTLGLSNVTGRCEVGLSGDQTFKFAFENAKIYDPRGYFVGDYTANATTNISGQLGSGVFDYYINGHLVGLGNPYPTGKYSWLFINPNGVNADFEGYIKGSTPDYSLPGAAKYQYQNHIITGNVVNNNSGVTFRIFNAQILDPTSSYTLDSFSTGNIVNTGYLVLSSNQLGLSDINLPIQLTTNFGDVLFSWKITGDYGVVPDLYLGVSPNENFIVNGITKNYTTQFSNTPSGSRLSYSLAYLSGATGNIYNFSGKSRQVSGVLSGVVTGRNRLSGVMTGLVSGLDPKTSIYETGWATGDIYTDYLIPVGDFNFNYTIPVSGVGNGTVQINYLAYGDVTGIYSGNVSVTGSYLTTLAYNFTGTGNNPGVATGIVPIGTGLLVVYPTGCLPITSGLIDVTDYYQATLSVAKVYAGALSYNYSILGVGLATGDRISGIVQTSFARNFEPGTYTFTKYFSGNVTGYVANTGTFDPIGCLERILTTGLLTGIFSFTGDLGCSDTLGMPVIFVSGFPSTFKNSSGVTMAKNTIERVFVTGATYIETSEAVETGLFTRTKISRSGYTPSGTGAFANPIRECNTPLEGFWKENVGEGKIVSGISGYFDDVSDNGFYRVRSYLGLSGSGWYDYGQNTLIAQDSGLIHFTIKGQGGKHIIFKGINFDDIENRLIEFRLYKNGFPLYGPYAGIDNTSALFWNHPLKSGIRYFDTYFEASDLTSGKYTLLVTAKPYSPPVIGFRAKAFSGCERSQGIQFNVDILDGVPRRTIYFETEYEDLSARSGVNYQPINLKYRYAIEPTSTYTYSGGFLGVSQPNYSWVVPIYNNSSVGGDHNFRVSLISPSGCTFADGLDFATGIILEDDIYITGTGAGGVVLAEDRLLDCVTVPFTEPPPFPDPPLRCEDGQHIYDALRECPQILPSCDGVPCCACDNYTTITTTCVGVPTILLVPSGVCSVIKVEDNRSTNGYLYVGELCAPFGVTYKDGFVSPACTANPPYHTKVFDSCCLVGQTYVVGSGYDGDLLPPPDRDYCQSYGITGSGGLRPAGPDCTPLKVFLSVFCTDSVSWKWSGYTSADDRAFSPVCPPEDLL